MGRGESTAEALEPAERPLNQITLPLECGVLPVQLTHGLLSWAAGSGGNERPEAMVVDKLPKPETVIALVSEQRRFRGFRHIGLDAPQDPWWLVGVGC